MGELYENDLKDEGKAFGSYSKGAEQEDAACMYHLGICYRDGRGVEADQEKADQWLKKAADLGNEQAQEALKKAEEKKQINEWIDLGTKAYEKENYGEAVEYFKKAAEQDNVTGLEWMGRCYVKGNGVGEIDYAKALEWYLKADELNSVLLTFCEMRRCTRWKTGGACGIMQNE